MCVPAIVLETLPVPSHSRTATNHAATVKTTYTWFCTIARPILVTVLEVSVRTSDRVRDVAGSVALEDAHADHARRLSHPNGATHGSGCHVRAVAVAVHLVCIRLGLQKRDRHRRAALVRVPLLELLWTV